MNKLLVIFALLLSFSSFAKTNNIYVFDTTVGWLVSSSEKDSVLADLKQVCEEEYQGELLDNTISTSFPFPDEYHVLGTCVGEEEVFPPSNNIYVFNKSVGWFASSSEKDSVLADLKQVCEEEYQGELLDNTIRTDLTLPNVYYMMGTCLSSQ